MIDSKTIAVVLSALAHQSRVDIFKCLLAHHPRGLNAGHLSVETSLAPSTLSHHLREMEKGGVVERSTVGQTTITSLNLTNLTEIMSSLMQLCCSVDIHQKMDMTNDLEN
jgi:DNA-binding transcriptional ArsR family regulator